MTENNTEQRVDDAWTQNAEQAPKPAQAQSQPTPDKDPNWERDLVNRLAFAAVNEQRRARRWGIFFKSLIFIYLFSLLLMTVDLGANLQPGKHTAVIEINGEIADDMPASADNVVGSLRDAFEDKNTAGIVLRINSPGGSPVQADYIYNEIKRLQKLHPETKVYAVITDICASGGYYIAAAADEIYANPSSLVGSIGVVMNGFGFVNAMNKLGVERRLSTAGSHKGFLDPFSPVNPAETKHLEGMLGNIHKQFITAVREGRGKRLKDNPDLFTGLIWTGVQAKELGLVDQMGSASFVAREVIGEENMVDFTAHESFVDRFAERIGMTMANVMSTTFSFGGRLQ